MTAKSGAPSEFLEAMQEAADILAGKRAPARVHRVPPDVVPRGTPDVDVRAIRRGLGPSQSDFAARFGVSLGAVREWEQGRRRSEQAARTLLLVIAHNPQAVDRRFGSGIERRLELGLRATGTVPDGVLAANPDKPAQYRGGKAKLS